MNDPIALQQLPFELAAIAFIVGVISFAGGCWLSGLPPRAVLYIPAGMVLYAVSAIVLVLALLSFVLVALTTLSVPPPELVGEIKPLVKFGVVGAVVGGIASGLSRALLMAGFDRLQDDDVEDSTEVVS